MKNAILTAIIVGMFATTGTASAYGGGGPVILPGFFSPNPELVCHDMVIQLPFQMTVKVPRCELKLDKDFDQRIKEFVDRVLYGGNQ